jgi:hypothetical protein
LKGFSDFTQVFQEFQHPFFMWASSAPNDCDGAPWLLIFQ